MDDGSKFARAIEKVLCRLTGLDANLVEHDAAEIARSIAVPDLECGAGHTHENENDTEYGFEGFPEEQVRVTGSAPFDHTAF